MDITHKKWTVFPVIFMTHTIFSYIKEILYITAYPGKSILEKVEFNLTLYYIWYNLSYPNDCLI